MASALAPTAVAATVLRGETSEGVAVKLRLDPTGVPVLFAVGGTTVACKHADLHVGRLTFSPFADADQDSFVAKARDRAEDGAIKFKSTTKITGTADDEAWRGSYRRRTNVFKHGDKIDTCVLQDTWTAS